MRRRHVRPRVFTWFSQVRGVFAWAAHVCVLVLVSPRHVLPSRSRYCATANNEREMGTRNGDPKTGNMEQKNLELLRRTCNTVQEHESLRIWKMEGKGT